MKLLKGERQLKKAVIWDLDGTLFDSYGVIVESIYLAFKERGIHMDMEQIHKYAIGFSIKALIANASQKYSVSAEELKAAYSRISQGKYLQIKPMDGALEILRRLENAGVENYVFTHRGKTTVPVLENLKMDGFFKEVITSQSGFARKPDPEGLNYLMEKYGLQKEQTWYVGDRSLDVECAANAGIAGVLYMPPGAIDVSGGFERFVISDLRELYNLLCG